VKKEQEVPGLLKMMTGWNQKYLIPKKIEAILYVFVKTKSLQMKIQIYNILIRFV